MYTFLLLVGASSGEVFVNAIPIKPSLAAFFAQKPAMPLWLDPEIFYF